MGESKAKKYNAVFSCGHEGYLYYYGGTTELLKALQKAEQEGLCPECRNKKLMKENTLVEMPYSVYMNKYKGKRKVVTGEYNEETHRLQVYLPPKLADEYEVEKSRVWYDAENVGINENNDYIISVFVKGNSYRLKDKLKELGYVWRDKHWRKNVVVFPVVYDDTDNKWLPPEDNPDFYSIVKELENLGCISNITRLNFNK